VLALLKAAQPLLEGGPSEDYWRLLRVRVSADPARWQQQLAQLKRCRRSAVGNTWAGWGSIPGVRSPYFFPWDGRSPVSNPTCDFPFPPRRPGEHWKGLIPARPSYQGVRGSVWDPDTSRELVGDWGGPEAVWALLCVAERRASRPNGEWGFIVSPPYAGPRAPRGGVTRNRRCTYRPSVIY
jgi:hypothetical protein